MTVEDHSDDDSVPMAEDGAACAQREDAATDESESSGGPLDAAGDGSEASAESPISPYWQRRFEELRDFRRQHGHLRFTQNDEPWPGLASWRNKQRVLLRQGKLSPVQQDWLDSIGFEWMAPGRLFSDRDENKEAVWRAHYTSLLRFKDKHGHTDVPESCKEYPKLGHWVQKQRQMFRRGHLREPYRELLDQASFSWQSGLSCHRLVWEERFKQMADFIREHGQDKLTESNEPVPGLVEWRDNQRAYYRKGKHPPERIAKLEAIGFTWRALERYKPNAKLEALWKTRFAELVLYKEKHGHTEVPASSKENPALGRWVGRQRENFALNRITPGHRELLEGIGFAWKCEKLNKRMLWDRSLARMADFIRQHGHDGVTQGDKNFPGLAQWREFQREKLRNGTLLPGRKERLDAIGFTWEAPENPPLAPEFDAAWEKHFAELLAFKESHGHTEVPNRWNGSEFLNRWVQKQRVRLARGTLRPERKKRLDDIGFAWKGTLLRFRTQWDQRFEQLVAFKREHGEVHVMPAQDKVLAIWCTDQRKKFREGTLLPERKARLDSIDFPWAVAPFLPPKPFQENERRWDEMLLKLQAYVAQHGHASVPHLWKENPALGAWTHKQRRSNKTGTLRADRKERLDALGFEWQIHARNHEAPFNPCQRSKVDAITLWERRFAALQAFHAKHGHVDVSNNEPEHRKLAKWLRQQRLCHVRGSLLFSQISRLEQLGIRWR